MKITIDKHDGGGFTMKLDRPPPPENRFKAVCALAAAGVYAGIIIGVAALCSLPGVVAIGVVTFLVAMITWGTMV